MGACCQYRTKLAGKENDVGQNVQGNDGGNNYAYILRIIIDTDIKASVVDWCGFKDGNCDKRSPSPIRVLTNIGSGLFAGMYGG